MISSDVDTLARQLYDARKRFGPPISDTAWNRFKADTPKSYVILVKVAEGLVENDRI